MLNAVNITQNAMLEKAATVLLLSTEGGIGNINQEEALVNANV